MNKQRGIIIGILALAVTMMVGYALFSETITINGTATAKGEFGTEVTCSPGVTDEAYNLALSMVENTEGIDYNEYKTTMDSMISKEGGYSNDTCTVDGKTISYKANLNYPGAKRYFTIKVKNSGSIPFHLKSINLSSSSLSGTVTGTDGTTYDATMLRTSVKENIAREPGAIAYDGTFNNNLDVTYQIINSGESIYFIAILELLEDIGITNGKSISAYDITASNTFNFLFEQATN